MVFNCCKDRVFHKSARYVTEFQYCLVRHGLFKSCRIGPYREQYRETIFVVNPVKVILFRLIFRTRSIQCRFYSIARKEELHDPLSTKITEFRRREFNNKLHN